MRVSRGKICVCGICSGIVAVLIAFIVSFSVALRQVKMSIDDQGNKHNCQPSSFP